MIWEVEYAPRAQEDLDEIFEYYATDQLDDSFAESLIVRLVKAADSLAEMPLRHRLYPEEPWQSVGVRFMPVGRYLIFYLPVQADRTVKILRIIHGARDLLTALQADKG